MRYIWLAKEIMGEHSKSPIMSGNMRDFSVVGEYGDSKIPFLFPYGVESKPINNEKLIVLDTGKGRACAGIVKIPECADEGEVVLYSSGGAYIKLSNNGDVNINGVVITKQGEILR